MEKPPNIWPAIYKALDVEYREHTEIAGVSGLTHKVQAIGVDEKTNRVVIISSEYNPRIAALMQVDIQATIPGSKVLVARPIPFDISHALRKIFQTASGQVDIAKILDVIEILKEAKRRKEAGETSEKKLAEIYGPVLSGAMDNAVRIRFPPLWYIIDIIQQLSVLNWMSLLKSDDSGEQKLFEATSVLMNYDNLRGDRENGICPLPTYEFSSDDWDLLQSGSDVELIRSRLKDLNVYQYFFPPGDSVALGFIEKKMDTAEIIGKGLTIAGERGHVVSENVLVPDAVSIPEVLEEFKSRGYVVEVEYETHLTAEGEEIRRSLRARPAEGLLEKLSRILSVKVDISLKDLFKP